jgi:hypothetical protein
MILLDLTSEHDRNLLASLVDPMTDGIFTNPFLKILVVYLPSLRNMQKEYGFLHRTRPPACKLVILVLTLSSSGFTQRYYTS